MISFQFQIENCPFTNINRPFHLKNMSNTFDAVIIIIYLVGILTIGILSVKLKNMSSDRYFLAGRGLKWPVIGAALFASNISTIHLVGLAASGYNEGLVWGNFEWLASITLILLALVFAPFYFKSKISTLPEFMEKRYGSGARTLLAIIAIIGALFVHIGLSLYAGAVVPFLWCAAINRIFSCDTGIFMNRTFLQLHLLFFHLNDRI